MRKKLVLLLALCVTVGTINILSEMQEIKATEIGLEMEKGDAVLKAEEISEGYTPIYDIADLYAIRNAPEGNYILMNDIDMSEDTSPGGDYDCGTGWDSIEEFSGTLDGNGHRIIGMHILGEFSSDAKIGLFELCSGATIKDIGIVDCELSIVCNGRDINVGTLTGRLIGSSSIENCYSNGNIVLQGNNDGDVGGLIGSTFDKIYSFSGEIENCYSACEINGSKLEGNCEFGGICGCFTTRTGVCTIKRCYNAGNIIGSELAQIGAICGYTDDSIYVKYVNCNYLKSSAARGMGNKGDNSDCVALTEAQMKNARLFTGFDFTDTWEIDPYCSYPYPQLKNNRMIKINSIELKSRPQKLIYNQGESLNLDGAAMGITYEDGITTMISLTKDMLSGYNMNKIGTQTVTVTYGGKQTSFGIEVKAIPVSSIKIPNELSISRSKEQRLNVTILPVNASNKTISWESDNPAVASVDKNGLVKAKSKGTTVITATSVNGLQAKYTVTVLVPAVSIQLSRTTLTLKEGKSGSITAKVLPLESTDTIQWTSSNKAVAEVYDGTIIAKKAGTATIRAYTENGVKAICTVTVQKNYDKQISKVTSTKAKITSAKNVKSKSIKLALKGISGCDGYEIQYGVKKNFKNAKSIRKNSNSVTIKKLKKGKTYYVRVRVYKKISPETYYGKWSSVKKIKIKK